MKIAAIHPPGGHFLPLMDQLANGMRIAGDEVVETLARHQYLDVDAVVCWGWRTGKRVRQFNPRVPVLVMERGYVGDRFHWTSLGWNGLNGRAKFPYTDIDGDMRYQLERWVHVLDGDRYWQPWRPLQYKGETIIWDNQYALILGQVQSDQACVNVNLAYQYRAWYSKLTQDGWKVRFRPHPKALRQGSGLPSGIYLQGSLEQDLAGAAFTVSWNSNSSVDSVLAGVPSVTLDEGAMAWPVTSHDLSNPVTMPSRTEWAAQLAWCQWQPAELSDGTAWKAVREVMP